MGDWVKGYWVLVVGRRVERVLKNLECLARVMGVRIDLRQFYYVRHD